MRIVEVKSYSEFINEKRNMKTEILNLHSPTELSGFYVIYKGSVQLEKPGWYGLSHLMEHLMCKNFTHLYDDFDREGISWNAYTSNHEIVFHLTGLEEFLEKWKQPFLESLLEFKITDEVLQAEKRIVLEEYDGSFSSQLQSHMLNLDRKLFNNYNAIGLREDIEKFKLEDCKEFFDLQFAKPSEIINVSNNNEFSTEIEFSKHIIPNNIREILKDNHPVIESIVEHKKSSTFIAMTPVIKEDIGIIDFITDMLGNGLQSPLSQEIREKRGLTYGVYCYNKQLSNNSVVGIIACQTDRSKIPEVIEALKEVISNPKTLLTQKRFEIIKQSIEISLKKSKINRYSKIRNFLLPEDLRPENYLKGLTLERVLEVYDKHFIFDELYLSEDKKEFKEEK